MTVTGTSGYAALISSIACCTFGFTATLLRIVVGCDSDEPRPVVDGDLVVVTHDLRVAGPRPGGDGAFVTLRQAREKFERDYVARVVEECGGNMSKAARVLGITSRTLRDRLKKSVESGGRGRG